MKVKSNVTIIKSNANAKAARLLRAVDLGVARLLHLNQDIGLATLLKAVDFVPRVGNRRRQNERSCHRRILDARHLRNVAGGGVVYAASVDCEVRHSFGVQRSSTRQKADSVDSNQAIKNASSQKKQQRTSQQACGRARPTKRAT